MPMLSLPSIATIKKICQKSKKPSSVKRQSRWVLQQSLKLRNVQSHSMSEDLKISGKQLQSQPNLHDFPSSKSKTKQSQPHSASKLSEAVVERRILEEQCNVSRKEIQLKGVQEKLQFLCEQDIQLPEVLGKDQMELRPATVIDHKLTKLQLQCLSDEELKMFST